jgi:hypothetical protein
MSEIENNMANLEINNDVDNHVINIFRYKLTDIMMVELSNFAKIHEYDHRNDFKEAWNKWVEEHSDLVSLEVRRLHELGCEKNVLDKMYKSARYYFRKKTTEKKEPKKRCSYKTINKEFIQLIDEHIMNNITKENFKPSVAFDLFCNENTEILTKEIKELIEKKGLLSTKEIKNKIKKTYQNRYFLAIKK